MTGAPSPTPMHHEVQVFDDLDTLSTAAAHFVVGRARDAVAESGSFHFAVSGGRSPWQMFARLTGMDMPWDGTVIWQVDERVAPDDDPERNLAHLRQALGGRSTEIRPMPVDEADLDAAARRYGDALPARLDLVHLGIGPDGHTASLVPGDAVLEVADRPVALTAGEYQGRRRMTLTYPALARARQLLWLVTGEDKRAALDAMLAGDPSVPAGRVVADASVVMADRAAHPG